MPPPPDALALPVDVAAAIVVVVVALVADVALELDNGTDNAVECVEVALKVEDDEDAVDAGDVDDEDDVDEEDNEDDEADEVEDVEVASDASCVEDDAVLSDVVVTSGAKNASGAVMDIVDGSVDADET
jgi:hypothetical protein